MKKEVDDDSDDEDEYSSGEYNHQHIFDERLDQAGPQKIKMNASRQEKMRSIIQRIQKNILPSAAASVDENFPNHSPASAHKEGFQARQSIKVPS